MTTLAAVAKHAGVGIGTASRVINEQPNVSPEMRRRVLESMEAVGYSPAKKRRPDPSIRAAYIGVLTVFFDEPSVYERLKGIVGYLQPQGYEVVIYNAVAPQQIRQHIEHATSHKLDGLIVVSAVLDDEEARMLRNAPFPVVLVDTKCDGFRSVGIDDRLGGELATRHLIDMGHRRIGFVGEPGGQFGFVAATLREQGYYDAHESAGIEIDLDLVRHGAHLRSAARQLTLDLLGLEPRVTAIVATSDVQALGVLEAAQQMGVRVPDDLSVIGYDDLEIAGLMGITTVRQQLEHSGARAAALILGAIAGSVSIGAHEELRLDVVVRNTTRPPR